MKRLALIVPLALLVTACGTTDPFEKRAEAERERQERYAERALDKAPKWMTELPKSNSAIYQNGTATSPDMSMSVNKAKTIAFGKICMAAGGRVDQQSKIYRLDSDITSTEQSEMAIKSFCPGVDISGTEVVETKMITEGGRFRTYVLVALPTGEANAVQTHRERQRQNRLSETRSREAFREMDRNQSRSTQ